ncbi:response regulator [Cohnella herbarum]|uniref:Response regulator n=1 Tax=Cohnella herbarum TaxID=2728023 RepID=A0A7Z2VQJ4_9BACL|nr:response regulator [Cohnella herbarum]QJD87346.1 response regulator [Cohnella herbarum]
MLLNVMIVDDEAPIRSGIKMKVDWEELGMQVAAEASDGAEALELIERGDIDLVITDITMPVMDGLNLIRKATEINDNVKFIIISGYSEFEYARTAMKYGISEYLLKPLKEAEMRASLLAVKEEILASEPAWLKEREKREKLKIKEESLLHWLSDKSSKHVPADVVQEWKQELEANRFLIGVIKTEALDSSADDPERIRNIVLYHEIETACSEHLDHLGDGYVIKNIRPDHEFILLLHPDPANGKDKIVRALTPFAEKLEKRLGIRVTIGIGEAYDQAHAIKASYREAVYAVKERLLLGTGKAIDYSRIPVKSDKPNFNAETKLLTRFLKEKKWDKAKEHIDYLFTNVVRKKQITNHTHVHELFFEVYFMIKQFSQEEAAVHSDYAVAGSVADITDIVTGFSHMDQMVDWLYLYMESACQHLIGGQDATGKEIVYRVQAYIKEFCSSDLTLNMVSEKYHINPIYFSRIFKTYTGESFNNYITRIRMEEAKHLLETTSLRQQEISEIVGYEDPKYFSKVFKKFFGISPSQYTENRSPEMTSGKP